MKKLIAIILSLMLVMSISLPAVAVSIIKVNSIKLNSSKITLKANQTVSLKVEFSPQNTTQKILSYTTSNKNVAVVDKDGKITAIGAGTATITVITANKAVTAKCAVTVSKPSAYTITALFPGDTPNDFDKVLIQAEKQVKDS